MVTQIKERVYEQDVGWILPVDTGPAKLVKERIILAPERPGEVIGSVNTKSEATSKEAVSRTSTAKTDPELVMEVAQALAYRAGIRNPLIIRAYNSVVTLRGQVDTEADLDLAEGVTLSLPGVKAVINGQTVKAGANARATSPENKPESWDYESSTPAAIPGWNLPTGELAILEGAEVFARNGKIGRVSGIVFGLPQKQALDLVVEKPEFLFKSKRQLSIEYIDGSYFVGNPAVFLKINRSEFNRLTEKRDFIHIGNGPGDINPVELIAFGKDTPIHFLGRKLGWLGGVLLHRQESSGPAVYNLSHYILKTSRNSKRLLLPFDAVEMRSGDKTLHLLPGQGELLMHPEQFNGYSEPRLVVERALEKLAWSSQMQHWGGRLRVVYRKGEVFLKGAMPTRSKPQDLVDIVGSVPGVRRVHNLIKVRT